MAERYMQPSSNNQSEATLLKRSSASASTTRMSNVHHSHHQGDSNGGSGSDQTHPILQRMSQQQNSFRGFESPTDNNNNHTPPYDYMISLSDGDGVAGIPVAASPSSPSKTPKTSAFASPPPPTTTSPPPTTSQSPTPPDNSNSNGSNNRPSWLINATRRVCPRWCVDLDSFQAHMHRMLKTRIWKFFMIIFSIFLLFGSSVQHLLPEVPTDEVIFDVFSCITLGFFIIDITLRILVEPNYFQLQCCGIFSKLWNRGNKNNNNNANVVTNANGAYTTNANGMITGAENPTSVNTNEFSIGSFMFWCDITSTGMLLYDISFINPDHYNVIQLDIELNEQGEPTTGFDYWNRVRPVNMEFLLLVTIGRCARLARFVRSRTVINASNQINWYWSINVLQSINPIQYWRKHVKRRQQQRMNSLGIAEESSSFVTQTASGVSVVSGAGSRSSRGSVGDDKGNRTSWGVLQIGIMAAVHAQAEAEAREAREARGNLFSRLKRYLRSIGVLESQSTLAARHAAAIKIQRAWRSHLRFENTASNDGGSAFGDFAMGADNFDEISLTGKGSHHSITSAERAIRKRSKLRAFASLNTRSGGKLDRREIRASGVVGGRPSKHESRFQSHAGTGRESQVGSDMRERTGQRVAIGVLLSLIFTVVFTYNDSNSTPPTAMVMLHEQTQSFEYRAEAIDAAVATSTPELYKFMTVDGEEFLIDESEDNDLRDRERLRVAVIENKDTQNEISSVGWFSVREERVRSAIVEIVATFFILIVWFFGVTAFAGPVMSLVVVPIERMVRLLGMLMLDPLGYQATSRFKKFIIEEDALIKNTRWTKDVLKGMETSFLMSTINRIGSLLKVGFGSAGVEIIRHNLQKGQSKNMLILNSQGSTVSCIFLFCDIRQFTDATECLQEEVFVFTNKIAAVVHSICHSYGGAANKNVGDAFLLSWSLEDGESSKSNNGQRGYSGEKSPPLRAKANQADKALLSVIKICIALYYDKYYLEPLSDAARNRLTNKLMKRAGPVVQMGFGLHAGKAVQGAIGSQRKIDATYVSEATERAEFLEGSTKRYGLKMLMSGDFHRLLHPNTRRRCRKIDQILLQDDDGDYDEDETDEIQGEIMSLYTFDMDVEAIHRPLPKSKSRLDIDSFSDAGSMSGDTPTIRSNRSKRPSRGSRRNMRRRRVSRSHANDSEELFLSGRESGYDLARSPSISGASVSSVHSGDESNTQDFQGPPELVLPTGPALYSHNVWQSPDMKRIRDKFVQSLFFQKFNAGLQAFYSRDWDLASQCFQTVLENFDDGPSKYFMKQIRAHKGVPPRDFKEYGLA